MELIYILSTAVFLNALILGIAIAGSIKAEIWGLIQIKRILKIIEQQEERICNLEKKTLEIYSKHN